MKEHSERRSRTILLPKYATIPTTLPQETYSARKTTYSPQKEKQVLPLRQFQDFFGKVKPSFFQELQHIFASN